VGRRTIKADYLLSNPHLDPLEIRSVLPASVAYKEAIDVGFVENCIKANKILPTAAFTL
jgi:hypothetical protein